MTVTGMTRARAGRRSHIDWVSGQYRVIAANSDGVRAETPAKLDFSIAPAYFQTT